MYTKESLDELTNKIDIYDVLQYVIDCSEDENRDYLCPFCGSDEFFVDDEKDTVGCLGCGFHGNAINLIMLLHKRSWEAAVKELADYYEIELKEVEECKNCKLLEKEINELKSRLKPPVIFRRYTTVL